MSRFGSFAMSIAMFVLLLALGTENRATAQGAPAKLGDEKSFKSPGDLTIKVRVMVPQDQETDLLFLCFFKHKKSGDTLLETIKVFDDKLGGLITALRNRGEFVGDELETILIKPPAGSIKAKHLMLIGLGDEDKMTLKTMGRVAKVAVNQAVRLGAKTAAFGPALRDQGYDKLPAADVERETVQAIVLAFDTEKKLQQQGLGVGLALEEWVMLAGPVYFPDVVSNTGPAITAAENAIKKRPHTPYMKQKQK